ncbi:MAG: EI24 domain-containing protein [bacterium]
MSPPTVEPGAQAAQRPRQPVPLGRASPLALLAGGREALRAVPGLRAFLWRGLVLNYLVFATLAALAVAAAYFLVVAPLVASLEGWKGDGGLITAVLFWAARLLVWVAALLLLAGSLVVSLILSFAMMGLWYEALATRIVAHWRPEAVEGLPAFALSDLLGGLMRSLRETFWLLVLALAALGLGLIPLAGPALVLAVDGYLLGWEARSPYLAVREALGDDPRLLRRGLAWWTFQTGLPPLLLAMLPVVGWLLLPALMIDLVAGVAWQGERAIHDAAR